MCGEKNSPTANAAGRAGSPPRVRGKAISGASPRRAVGITPACAGKREKRVEKIPQIWDHPRVCGEKVTRHRAGHPPRGSPPRVRGKVTRLYALADKEGITPACAGKSHIVRGLVKLVKDHPRVCGEKPAWPAIWLRPVGSPPRVRGKGVKHSDGRVRVGITPACAGKRARGRNPKK